MFFNARHFLWVKCYSVFTSCTQDVPKVWIHRHFSFYEIQCFLFFFHFRSKITLKLMTEDQIKEIHKCRIVQDRQSEHLL